MMSTTKMISYLLFFLGLSLAGLPVHASYRWHVGEERVPELQSIIDKHPQLFAGVSKDISSQRIIVRVAQSASSQSIADVLNSLQSPPLINSLSGQRAHYDVRRLAWPKQWPIALQSVRYSMAELRKTERELLSNQSVAKQLRPVISQWSIDVLNNRVKVGVTQLNDQLRQHIARYFSDRVQLVKQSRMQWFSRPIAAQDGTLSGGAQIVRPSGSRCSSGFPVQMAGSNLRGFTTAGHCALNQPEYPEISSANEKYLGHILSYRWGFAQSSGFDITWTEETDSSLVFDYLFSGEAEPQPFVYVGDSNSNLRRYVHNYRQPELGETVCFGGALTGENCRGVVTNVNVSAVFYIEGGIGMLLNGLVEATS